MGLIADSRHDRKWELRTENDVNRIHQTEEWREKNGQTRAERKKHMGYSQRSSIHVTGISEGDKGEWGRKDIWRDNGEQFYKFHEWQPTDARSSVNPRRKNIRKPSLCTS